MRRLMLAASVLAFTLVGFSGEAFADDGEEDEYEEVVVRKKKKKKSDDNVQVIVIEDDEEAAPRRRRRPKKLTAIPGEEPPPGYHTETSTYKGVWIAGISLFGSSYLLSLISGAIADGVEGHDEGRHTYYNLIPVAGPFISAAHDEIQGPGKMPFILFGIIQAGGMGMFIGGLSAKKHVWVSDEIALSPELLIGPGSIGLRQQF